MYSSLVISELYNTINVEPIMLYLFWTSMHYVSVHIYTEYCAHWSWYGFITSPFYTMNPFCKGLNWFIYESSSSINHLFITLGTFLILNINKHVNVKNNI